MGHHLHACFIIILVGDSVLISVIQYPPFGPF